MSRRPTLCRESLRRRQPGAVRNLERRHVIVAPNGLSMALSTIPSPQITASIAASIPRSAKLASPSTGAFLKVWNRDMLFWRAGGRGARSLTPGPSRTGLSPRTHGSMPQRQTAGSILRSAMRAPPTRSKPITEAASTSSR